MVSGRKNPSHYKKGEIVCYTRYDNDLINSPDEIPTPRKYFKVKSYDRDYGTVDHETDSVGISYIRKTTIFEKVKYWIFWS